MMHTGLIVSGRPSLGSWVAYGLGTENQNLPAYVVLPDPGGLPVDGIRNWSSGWMPPLFQGTPFRSEGDAGPQSPAEDAASRRRGPRPPRAARRAERRSQGPPSRRAGTRRPHRQLRAGRPHAALGDRRPRHLPAKRRRRIELYGLDNPTTQAYGRRCLMARRLVERGVRFVQMFLSGQPWDTHNNNAAGIAQLLRPDRSPRRRLARPT